MVCFQVEGNFQAGLDPLLLFFDFTQQFFQGKLFPKYPCHNMPNNLKTTSRNNKIITATEYLRRDQQR